MAGEEGFEPSYAGIKIRCLNQLGDSPVDCTVFCRHYAAQSWSGCCASPCVTKPRMPPGNSRSSARASASVLNSANTHAPEPVMRAPGTRLFSHSRCDATSGKRRRTTDSRAFAPCPHEKGGILSRFVSRVNEASEKISFVETATCGVKIRYHARCSST